MNCLDCALAGTASVAVATCHSCGAAVCADHAVIQPHHLHRIVPLDRPVPVEPPARLVTCNTCAAAQHAAQHPEPLSRHRFGRRQAARRAIARTDRWRSRSTSPSISPTPATTVGQQGRRDASAAM